MQATIFGTGHVGLISSACLAEIGNHAVCVDVGRSKFGQLSRSTSLYTSPVVDHGYIGRRLWAVGIFCRPRNRSGSWASPVYFGERTFVDEDGFADLRHVLAVACSIGEYMDSYRIIQ